MPSNEEEGFTVRDRRRFTAEEAAPSPEAAAQESPAASAAAPPAPDPAPPPAGGAPGAASAFSQERLDDLAGDEGGPEEDDLPHELPDVYSVLAMFLGELRNLAWIRMGLVANPLTGVIERDLAQAKVAIDTAAFLASQLEPVVPAEERLPLRALVSDLQMNFVEQSKRPQ